MKTAMQELFEYWDTQNNPLVILNWIASNEKRLLEKEKLQIMRDFEEGWLDCFNDKGTDKEKYYNQTYNKKNNL